MQLRTDLALERRDMAGSGKLKGVISEEYKNADCKATVIKIISDKGSEILKKPKGKYITLEMDTFPDTAELNDGRLSMLIYALSELIPPEGDILVAGLGNPAITPDAIGPICARSVLATRHISDRDKKALNLPVLRDVSVITPGVTGKTGIETTEIISGVIEKTKPAALIAVDALASMSVERLARTVQLSDTGITPGSGVGNSRVSINKELLGIPVIAIGVPTVVDALSLAAEISGTTPPDSMERYKNMIVAPKDTDIIISGAARLIALGINCALQKNLTPGEIISLTLP